MRIGQLAERSGVSADTIRYYETIGLLPKAARTSGGYREYRDASIGRVRLVQNALRFGLSLKQVGAFLGVHQAGWIPCKNVRAAGDQILESIEQKIAELTAFRESIKETLKQWDRRLLETPEGQPAHLLEALAIQGAQSLVGRHLLVGKRSQ